MKIIYNIDKFIVDWFIKVSKLIESKGFFISILGLFLVIISLIIFAIPMIILGVIYNFVDRDQLKKAYEKERD